jgi:hypothetical protein
MTAIERPGDSQIAIDASSDSVTISIPKPRMPWAMIVAIAISGVSLLSTFLIGFMVLFIPHGGPFYHEIVGGDFSYAPLFWKAFVLVGWLVLISIGAALLLAAVRPLTRRESIELTPESLTYRIDSIGKSSVAVFENAQLIAFDCHPDVQGLMESELRMWIAAKNGGPPTIVQIATSTNEAEKQWLASAFNALLNASRRHPPNQ